MSNIKLKTVTKTRMTDEDAGDFDLIFTDIDSDSVKVTKTENGFEVRYLVQDNDSESPNEWEDKNVILVHYHRSFELRRDEIITKEDAATYYSGKRIPQQRDYHIFPVCAYIHSGVALSLSDAEYPFTDRWDTSHVGLLLLAKEEWKTKKKALKFAKSYIETWNTYLSGDVWGIVKEDFDSNRNHITYDSVWGFYGREYALEALDTEV